MPPTPLAQYLGIMVFMNMLKIKFSIQGQVVLLFLILASDQSEKDMCIVDSVHGLGAAVPWHTAVSGCLGMSSCASSCSLATQT